MQLHFACGSGPLPTGKRKREDFTFHLQGVPGSAAPEGAGKGVPQGGKRDSADKRCLSGGSARIQMQPGRNTSRNSSRNSSGLCEPPLPSERALQPSPVTQQGARLSQRLPQEFGLWLHPHRAGTGSCAPRHRSGVPSSLKGWENKSKAIWTFKEAFSSSFYRTEGIKGKEERQFLSASAGRKGPAQALSVADLWGTRGLPPRPERSQAGLESRMGNFRGNTHTNTGNEDRGTTAAPQPNPGTAHLSYESHFYGKAREHRGKHLLCSHTSFPRNLQLRGFPRWRQPCFPQSCPLLPSNPAPKPTQSPSTDG